MERLIPGLKTFYSPYLSEPGLNRRDEFQKQVDEFIDGVEPDSAQWKAFADFTDYIEAKYVKNARRPYTPDQLRLSNPELRLGNIEETIRQRTNEVPSYKKAYKYVEALADELEFTQPSLELQRRRGATIIFLKGRKNQAIEMQN